MMSLNLALVSERADVAYERVGLPHAASLKPVERSDSLPVKWLTVRGRVTVFPLLARAITTVNIPLVISVKARSTY